MSQFTPWEERNAYYKGLDLGKDVKSITASLNNKTKAMIASQMASASAIVASQERIREGIDAVAIGVDRVCEGIDGLQAAFEWGISEIVWQIEQNREVLKSILDVLSAPLDTQSKELRKRAEEAYLNGWIDDALTDFLESEAKNRYDFAVHISLGIIYLKHKKDTAKALEYFEKAIKYAKPKSTYYTSFALLQKAIIKYSAGLVKEAEESTAQAVELSPSLTEALYQNAQYNAQLKNSREAISNLEKAIRLNKFYASSADSDKMFDPIRIDVDKLLKELRELEKNYAVEAISEAKQFFKKSSVALADQYFPNEFKINTNKLNKSQLYFDRQSLFDYADSNKIAVEVNNQLLEIFKKTLVARINELNKQKTEAVSPMYGVLKRKKSKLNSIKNDTSALIINLGVASCIAGCIVTGGKDVGGGFGIIFILVMTGLFLYYMSLRSQISNIEERIQQSRQHYELEISALNDQHSQIAKEGIEINTIFKS